jgi:hypothetical protein
MRIEYILIVIASVMSCPLFVYIKYKINIFCDAEDKNNFKDIFSDVLPFFLMLLFPHIIYLYNTGIIK